MENLQKEISDFQHAKKFDEVAITQQMLQLHGEVNEAYEAWRREDIDNLAEELADVAIYTYGLATHFGIDLNQAIQNKLAKNAHRKYTNIDGQIYEIGKSDTPVQTQ